MVTISRFTVASAAILSIPWAVHASPLATTAAGMQQQDAPQTPPEEEYDDDDDDDETMNLLRRATWHHPIGMPDPSESSRMDTSAFGAPPEFITIDVSSSSSSSPLPAQRGNHSATEPPPYFPSSASDDTEPLSPDFLFSPSSPNTTTTDPTAHSPRGIIAPTDDRHLHVSTAYPFSAMGKIQWSNGVFCSGALVGPRHVATVRHCTPHTPQDAGVSVRFMPSFDLGERFPGARVTTVLSPNWPGSAKTGKNAACDWRYDWAVLVLDKPLGRDRGYLGVRAPLAREKLGTRIMRTLGWPGDLGQGGNRPFLQTGRAVRRDTYDGGKWCDGNGPLVSDADAAGGQSGSPLWEADERGGRWVYGMLSVTAQGWTAAAAGRDWVDAVVQARKRWP